MSDYDAIIIGGGPAGSTVAARLAQRGRRVVLLEQERFPRFHIGESLLPSSMPLFEQLGVKERLDREGFLPKYGAEFVTGDGGLTRRYEFADGIVDGLGQAYEVDRAAFDRVLLEHAAELGVEVRQGVRATAFETSQAVARVVARGADGASEEISARCVVDATGQNSLIARQLGLRVMDQALKNFAVFSHYEGADRAQGKREGDITVVIVPEGWWWVIPLASDRTSLGFVAPAAVLAGRKPNEEYFEERVRTTPYLARRFAAARRVAPVRAASDYSFSCRRVVGPRWVLAGDAAGFIDPVFSTGVCLGMQGAFRIADAIDAGAGDATWDARRLAGYARWHRRAMQVYRGFVRGFYRPEFVEVLLNPSDTLSLRQAVTSLLAGRGVGSFDVTWRIWTFRAIVGLNRRLALVPRLPGRREAAAAL
jgi:flavin-dependent dehydrogenase